MIRCKDCDMAFHIDRLTDGRCKMCQDAYEEYLSPSAGDIFKCTVCKKKTNYILLGKKDRCPCGGITFNTEDDNYEAKT